MHGILGCPAHEFQSLGTEQHRSSTSTASQVFYFFSSVFFRRYLMLENVKGLNSSTGLKDSMANNYDLLATNHHRT